MGFEDGPKGADLDVHRSSRYAGRETPRLIGADIVRRNIADQLRSKSLNQGLERVLVQFAGITRAPSALFLDEPFRRDLDSGISFGFVIRLISSSRSRLRFRSASSASLFELVFVLSRIREPAKANSYQ
jgi:hypothetical protein